MQQPSIFEKKKNTKRIKNKHIAVEERFLVEQVWNVFNTDGDLNLKLN